MPRDRLSPEGFEAIVREHQTAVFRTLHRLTGPGPHLEDLAQEVFLRLYRALPDFRGDAELSTYLYRITYNVAQDEWKRRRRDRTLFAPVPPALDDAPEDPNLWLENQPSPSTTGAHHRSPEHLLQHAQAAAAVEAALLTLPDAERAVLVLYHTEELSYDAIAQALAIPINTVRTHLHRGRKRIATLLQSTSPSSAVQPTTGYPLQRPPR